VPDEVQRRKAVGIGLATKNKRALEPDQNFF